MNIIHILLIEGAIAFSYALIKRVMLIGLGEGLRSALWQWRFQLVEDIFLPIMTLILLISLTISLPLVGVVVAAILLMVFLKPLKNFISGLLYRIGDTYTIGQRIKIDGVEGAIRNFRPLSVELALEEGGILDIPYSRFTEATILRISANSGVLSHVIQLKLSKPCNLEREELKVKQSLFAIPYVLPNHKISLEHVSESSEYHLIDVTIHGIDKTQMHKVEERLKSKMESVLVV